MKILYEHIETISDYHILYDNETYLRKEIIGNHNYKIINWSIKSIGTFSTEFKDINNQTSIKLEKEFKKIQQRKFRKEKLEKINSISL